MKELKNIQNSGFKTPDNYFDGIEDQVMSKIKLDNMLDNASDSGFKAPENYFDSLEDKVFDKLQPKEETKVVSIFRSKYIAYISGVAAMLLLSLIIFTNNDDASEIDLELVESYIINEDNIDAYDLAELLTEEDFEDVEEFSISTSDDELEDYLLDNIDIEDIYIE